MSMLGSFFNKSFKASQCKTLMKLTIPRIKLLRNRREIQLKQMRKEIAKLLETGQEATARIRVEHIIREENMMAAQEILELFCELIVVRLPIIESQKECPLDLKEAISSVCFAAPRCADLSELQQVQLLFASKYGNEFVIAATELMPNCGVNRQLIELLSVRAPSPEKKLKFLKDIAVEHELDWDPAASETELFKPHGDLLTGLTQFISGSTLPVPKEKHNEALNSVLDQTHEEQTNSDVGLDDLDFPEVPKVSVAATGNAIPVAPEAVPCSQIDDESCLHSGRSTDLKEESYLKDEEIFQERVAADKDDPCTSLGSAENKQFIPFISPPSVSNASPFSVPNASHSATSDNSPLTHSGKTSEAHVDLREVLAATQATAETADHAEAATGTSKRAAGASGHSPPLLSGKKCETYIDLQDELAAAQSTADTALEAEAAAEIAKRVAAASSNSPSTLSGKGNEAKMDLQDILAAAQVAIDTAERAEAAAESAKHAAAAARSAASLAQARISELKKNGAYVLDSSCENPFHAITSNQNDKTEPTHFNAPIYGYDEVVRSHSAPHQGYGSSEGLEASHISSFDKLKADFDSSLSHNHALGDTSVSHQPKRLLSMDDETYFSYPNLFTSQTSTGESHSPSETSRFTHDL